MILIVCTMIGCGSFYYTFLLNSKFEKKKCVFGKTVVLTGLEILCGQTVRNSD